MSKRTKSSRRWLDEHFSDEYVKRSQREGWRSRAVYKLAGIQEKDRILKPGMTVIDLGAAPGGWSEYARSVMGKGGRVIAMDILEMEPLDGVTFLRGDFTEDAPLQRLIDELGDRRADLVMSDMAPNMSGMKVVDQPKIMYLAELTHDLARQVLAPGGDMLVKVFQGEGFDEFLKALREDFAVVKTRKPGASRDRSREVYLLARNYRV